VRFGVHVGIGGGFEKTIAEARAARCECIQIFAGNPRGFRRTPYDATAWAKFRALRERYDINPTVIHSAYLVNLVTASAALNKISVVMVANDLDVAARGGIEYVNTHLGSYGGEERRKGFARVCKTIAKLVKGAKPGPLLLLENAAGAGNLCGGTLEELGAILGTVGSERVGVCLDTAHAWAAGYAIADERGVDDFVRLIERHIGFERVRVLHLNDTEVELGAKRDRHWHVGKGKIGNRGFRALLRRPELAHVAVICETPKTPELDRANVRAARTLAGVRRPTKNVGPGP
jgi:deoxyribonuclease IV